LGSTVLLIGSQLNSNLISGSRGPVGAAPFVAVNSLDGTVVGAGVRIRTQRGVPQVAGEAVRGFTVLNEEKEIILIFFLL